MQSRASRADTHKHESKRLEFILDVSPLSSLSRRDWVWEESGEAHGYDSSWLTLFMLELWLSGPRGCCWNKNREPGGMTTHQNPTKMQQWTLLGSSNTTRGTNFSEAIATNWTKNSDVCTAIAGTRLGNTPWAVVGVGLNKSLDQKRVLAQWNSTNKVKGLTIQLTNLRKQNSLSLHFFVVNIATFATKLRIVVAVFNLDQVANGKLVYSTLMQ